MSTPTNEHQPLLPLAMKRLAADMSRFSDPAYLSPDGSIVVPHTVASAFGGTDDMGDDGRTASGLRTDRAGGIVGCALPMPAARGCHGTPFAQLPWRTLVHVTCGAVTAAIPVIDEGPSGGLSPCRLIDLTCQAWSVLLKRPVAPHEANTLTMRVSFTIPGAAKFMRDYRPQGARV